MKDKFKRALTFRNIILILIILVAVGTTIAVAKTKPEVFGIAIESADPDVQVQNEKLLKEISKIIELPAGETPQVAIVSDMTKLTSSPFFQNAQMGDAVLIYQGAKKAYLYRPSEKKIIEVGVVNLPTPSAIPTTVKLEVTPAEQPVENESITPKPVSVTATPTLVP